MRELLLTDLRRIIKDKLFLVACILGGVFALFTPLLYEGIVLALGDEVEMLGPLVEAKALFFSAFLPGGNFGLILPILVAIVLCKDFRYGTVRNKIIAGKPRTAVFFSLFLSTATVTCGVILAHALLTLLVSLFFFPYAALPFTWNSFLYLFVSLLFSLLVYLFLSALISFLAATLKSAGLTVVLYVAVNFFFSILGTVTAVAAIFIEPTNKALTKLLEILQKANLFTTTHIGAGTAYTATDVLTVLVPTLLGSALCLGLGAYLFKKRDLK